MKKLCKILIAALCLTVVLCFCACGNMGDGYYGGRVPSGSDSSFAPDVSGSSDKIDGEMNGGTGESGDDYTQMPISKQLTAAEWNDLSNYEFWQSLFLGKENQHEARIFYEYAASDRGLNTRHLHAVKVVSGNVPVAGAKVTLYGGNNALYSAVTDGDGNAYLFGENATSVMAESGEFITRTPVVSGVTTVELYGYAQRTNNIDIMLTVDTTGSMGDELDYLKKEISGVVQRIAGTANADVNLGMVFYRDYSFKYKEEYLTRKFDFINVNTKNDLNTALKNINAQYAGGGDDIPEAVDEALKESVNCGWREDSTKIMFFVLDAPYHDSQDYCSKFAEYVKVAAAKGIRIIPVAASGLDTLGQYIMRSAAMLTGGTYTFITDDSGIGDHHEEPAVGGYDVEYLSDLMVRLVLKYHSGTSAEA